MLVMTEESALEQLRERMRGERSGEVEVIDVRTEYRLDSYAEEYVSVVLVVTDPAPGRDTWPLRDVHALRRRVEDEAEKLAITTRVGARVTDRPDDEEGDE